MEFLDLTDATDSEKREIQEILFAKTVIPGLELPFEPVYLKKLVTDTNTSCSNDQPNNIHPDSSANSNGTVKFGSVNCNSVVEKGVNVTDGPCISNGTNDSKRINNVSTITNTNTSTGKVTLNKNKGKRRGGGNANVKCDVQVNGAPNCDINGRRNNTNVNGVDLSGKVTNGQVVDGHETDSSSSDASYHHHMNGGVNGIANNPLSTSIVTNQHQHQQPLAPQIPPVTSITTIAPTTLQPLPHGHPVYPMVTPIPVITSMSSLAPHPHAFANAPPNSDVLQANVLRPGQGASVTANAVSATGASIPFPYSIAPNGTAFPAALPTVTTGGHNGQQGHTFAAHTSSHPHPHHQPIYPSPYFPPPYHYVFLPFPHGPPHSHPSHPHPGATASPYHPSHPHQVPLVQQIVASIEEAPNSSNTTALASSVSPLNNSNNNTNTDTTQVESTGPSEIFKEPALTTATCATSSSLVSASLEEEEKQENTNTNSSTSSAAPLATTPHAVAAIIESPDDSSSESVSSLTANTSTCPLSSPPSSCITDCSVPSTISSPVNLKDNPLNSGNNNNINNNNINDNNNCKNNSPTSANTCSTNSVVTSSISSSEDEENTVALDNNNAKIASRHLSSSASSAKSQSSTTSNNSIPPVNGVKSWSSLFKSNNNSSASLSINSSSSIHTSAKSSATLSTKMAPVGPQFKHVCLGGTFDTIHEGHHKLLSQAVAICTEILTIGVTDESMLGKKTLAELIRPLHVRVEDVKGYVNNLCKEQGKKLTLNIQPIFDPFGPAITDDTISAIVVSQETISGGKKINEIRKSKGFTELEVFTVDLVEAPKKESNLEENKVSSSTARLRRLGTLIREPNPLIHNSIPYPPYLIGLSGGIAAGKSNIANELAKLGAGIIDSDKVAHSSYEKGTDVYKQIISEFGSDVLDGETQQINRRKLGEKVFGNSQAKCKLESIVWPATRKLVENEIRRLNVQDKKEVIIVEAAQLIEAKWQERLHQIWVTFVPEGEAIKRTMERNNLSMEEAKKRVAAQMSNKERLSHANVVFCTLWDRAFTHTQVLRAWDMLHKRFIKK